MRRQPPESREAPERARRRFVFLWKRCIKCHEEFRFEGSWMLRGYFNAPNLPRGWITRFVCYECCHEESTPEKAARVILEQVSRGQYKATLT